MGFSLQCRYGTGPLITHLLQWHTKESGVGLRWPLCSLRDLHPHPPHSHRQAEANHPVHPQNVRFQNVRFQTSETSGLQNVMFTKCQFYKTSGLQNVRLQKNIHIYSVLVIVGNPQVLCSYVCRQRDGRVLFSILEVFFLPYITIININ
jgi:hypothetical protein